MCDELTKVSTHLWDRKESRLIPAPSHNVAPFSFLKHIPIVGTIILLPSGGFYIIFDHICLALSSPTLSPLFQVARYRFPRRVGFQIHAMNLWVSTDSSFLPHKNGRKPLNTCFKKYFIDPRKTWASPGSPTSLRVDLTTAVSRIPEPA